MSNIINMDLTQERVYSITDKHGRMLDIKVEANAGPRLTRIILESAFECHGASCVAAIR